jgi:hypothetical protein
MADETTAIDVETFAHTLNDKQLRCRELGHVWVAWAVEVVREGRRVGGYSRVFKCRQCRSERHQTIDSRGHVVTNGYRYADGYLATMVRQGFTRDVFRLESVTRWLDAHANDDDKPNREREVS